MLYDPAPQTDPGVVETLSFSSRSRIAEDEARQNARILMRRDTDKDGRLNAAELGARMAAFFTVADSNSDDFVTLTEATRALEAAAATEEEAPPED